MVLGFESELLQAKSRFASCRRWRHVGRVERIEYLYFLILPEVAVAIDVVPDCQIVGCLH